MRPRQKESRRVGIQWDGGHAHLNQLIAHSFGANAARVIEAVRPIVLQPSHALRIVMAHVDTFPKTPKQPAPQTRTQLVSSSISACLYITYADKMPIVARFPERCISCGRAAKACTAACMAIRNCRRQPPQGKAEAQRMALMEGCGGVYASAYAACI